MDTAVQAIIGPETLALAAAGLTVEAVSFEKTRALEIYLPMLRASYDFAHGNPNPALPGNLERLARVEGSIELLAAPEVLNPEAQAAVANDLHALDQEADRNVVAGAVANPGGFGFVARVKNTDEFIVSIRGTQTPEEWARNFTAVPNPVERSPGIRVRASRVRAVVAARARQRVSRAA